MTRYRNIECQIWNDDIFPYLDDDSQAIWFHIYTHPTSNGIGLFSASIEGLNATKNKNGQWLPQRFRKGFGNLCLNDLIRFDERHQVVYFPKFFERECNRPQNPNVLKGLLKAWPEVPDQSPLKLDLYQRLEGYCNEWGEGFKPIYKGLPKPSPKPLPKPMGKQEQEQEQEQEPKEKRLKTLVKFAKDSPEFRIFEYWKATLNHPRAALDQKRKRKIQAALKNYDEDFLCRAILGCSKTPHNMGHNDRGEKYDSIDLILRDAEHIERFERNSRTEQQKTSTLTPLDRVKIANQSGVNFDD